MIHLVVGQGRYARAVKLPFWAVALGGATFVAIVVLLVTLIAGAALVVVPALLVGAAVARLLSGRPNSAAEPIFTRNRRADPNIIEGEYRVLDDGRR